MFFYVERQGIYGQGVVWVGDDENKARRESWDWAKNDGDSYHEYIAYQFVEDDEDIEICRFDKDRAEAEEHRSHCAD